MNRRGDVPTIMVLVVAVLFVSVSLFAFASFKGTFSHSGALHEISADADFGQKYILREAEFIGRDAILNRSVSCISKDISDSFMCISETRDLRASLAGNFFGKIRDKQFQFLLSGPDYVFRMSGIKLGSGREANAIVRNFDLEIRFNAKGEVLEEKISSPSLT